MIYVEGQPLDVAQAHFKKYYDDVTQRLKQVSQASGRTGFAIVFKVRPSNVTVLETTKDHHKVNTTGDYCVSFHQVVHDKNLNKAIDWVYSETPLPERDGRADVTKAPYGRWMFTQDRQTEIIKDIDLAFFLYHVDPHFGEAAENKMYQLVDARGADEKQVESQVPEINFKYVLYGDGSPLADKEALVIIARAWGVEMADTKPEASLKIALERAVKQGELEKLRGNKFARGIKEFLVDVKQGEKTKLRALVQLAIDKKVIRAVSDSSRSGVFWIDEYGQIAEKIIDLTPRNQKYWKDILTDYLVNDPKSLDMLKSELGIGGEEKESIEYVSVDMDEKELQEFFDRFFDDDMKGKTREVAIGCGIQPYGLKKNALKQVLLEYFEKEKGFKYKDKIQT